MAQGQLRQAFQSRNLGLLPDKHRLKNRGPSRLTLNSKTLHDVSEWKILVAQRPQNNSVNAGNELVEFGIAGQIETKRQRVHKTSDNIPKERIAAAPGRGTPDDHLILPGLPVEQQSKGREHVSV